MIQTSSKDLDMQYSPEAFPVAQQEGEEAETLMRNDLDSFINPESHLSQGLNLQAQIKNIDSIFEPEPEEHTKV